MRTHVAFVYRDATRPTGGLTIDIRNLANALVRGGDAATVIGIGAAEGRGVEGLDPGVRMVSLAPRGPNGLAISYGIASGTGRALREIGPDLVHVFSCLPVYFHFAAMSAARRQGKPVVWTPMIHPLREQMWREYGIRGRAMRVFDASVPRIARRVDAVAAATEAEAAEFLGLGSPRVELIPPAVDSAQPVSRESAASLRRQLGLEDVPMVLTVAGRAERRKGIDFCRRSFELVRDRIPDATLVLVASGLAETRHGVRVLNGLADEELRALYRAADAVFVPSQYEAFSRVVIEAWEQARPVVVTDGVALASTVQDQRGLVVGSGEAEEAAAALESLLRDREAADTFGRRGRELVEAEYSVAGVAARAQALYADLNA